MPNNLSETNKQIPPEDAKPIPGFSGYLIDPSGAVWSNRKKGSRTGETTDWWLMKLRVRHGYLIVNLRKAPKTPERWYIHRLVAKAFIGPDNGMFVLHKDDNRLNNHVSNLYYGTHKDNVADYIRNGKLPLGEQRSNAKLTNAQIREMRELAKGGIKHKILAERFAVSALYVNRVIRRETWRKI